MKEVILVQKTGKMRLHCPGAGPVALGPRADPALP
jgi:hypothetical protein